MSDSLLVDPQGWEYDLQSVYSAYMGHFQLHGTPWHDRTWGHFFETFEHFLAFSWPVITVTDARTGRAHIVTRMASIAAFVKMIKLRFGETLPQVDNVLLVKPFETTHRHLRHVNDFAAFKKLHSALPAVALAAFKARVRAGDPNVIRELWMMRDKTFLALDFECLERNDRTCVEWGYAVIRCGHLEAAGAWPPSPGTNYRKGHYIISEYVDVFNKASPTASWQYAFGESQVIPKMKMPRIVQSVLSLVSPDAETVANNVVLIGHGIQMIVQRLEEMKIKLPNNVLTVDIAYLERALYNTGERGPMHDRKTGRLRLPESLLSLGSLLRSLGIDPPCVLHNAGNDAFMTLVAFQRMADPRGASVIPQTMGIGMGMGMGPWVGMGMGTGMGMGMMNGMGMGVTDGTRKGEGKASNGDGHVKRAATVAARFFRPLGGTQHGPGANDNEKGTGKGNSKGNAKGNAKRNVNEKENEKRRSDLPRLRNGSGGGGGGADEMGVVNGGNKIAKRASMFSMLTSPLLAPTDKRKADGDDSRSTSESGTVTGLGFMSGWSIGPGSQRRHSAMERRR